MNPIQANRIIEQDLIMKGRKNLLAFSAYTFPDIEWKPVHKNYYRLLNMFAYGKIKKLMISMPPQHGKSEGSTRRLPSFMLGLNPDLKIALTSYNHSIAAKFNLSVQRIIDNEHYQNMFPDTSIVYNSRKVKTNFLRNTTEVEVVGKRGGIRSVGRGGSLTGHSVDIAIMDDLYKDYADGNSPLSRKSVWDWYTAVVRTRLHNDSQQLIVFTRWHEDDIIGRIEKTEKVHLLEDINDIEKIDKNTWIKINFEAIKTGLPTPIDPREEGEPLWPERHGLAKLQSERDLDPIKFDCLYQGNPKNVEGMLYQQEWKTYKTLPDNPLIMGNYTDTADTGTDYLCSVCYNVYDKGIYVTDVLYTTAPMEITLEQIIKMFASNGTKISYVESNAGGRFYSYQIDERTPTSVIAFGQGSNKESRILSMAAMVQKFVHFPEDWALRFPKFWSDLTNFKRIFKANKHDDAADVMTGIIEKHIYNSFVMHSYEEDQDSEFSKGRFTGADSAPWFGEDNPDKGPDLF